MRRRPWLWWFCSVLLWTTADTHSSRPLTRSTTTAPTFYPPAGVYPPSTELHVLYPDNEENPIIRFTVDGTRPGKDSQVYNASAPIVLSISGLVVLLTATAQVDGQLESLPISGIFTCHALLLPPFGSPSPNEPYPYAVNVSLATDQQPYVHGIIIRYTVDESSVTEDSPQAIQDHLHFTQSVVIKARAYHPVHLPSVEISLQYRVQQDSTTSILFPTFFGGGIINRDGRWTIARDTRVPLRSSQENALIQYAYAHAQVNETDAPHSQDWQTYSGELTTPALGDVVLWARVQGMNEVWSKPASMAFTVLPRTTSRPLISAEDREECGKKTVEMRLNNGTEHHAIYYAFRSLRLQAIYDMIENGDGDDTSDCSATSPCRYRGRFDVTSSVPVVAVSWDEGSFFSMPTRVSVSVMPCPKEINMKLIIGTLSTVLATLGITAFWLFKRIHRRRKEKRHTILHDNEKRPILSATPKKGESDKEWTRNAACDLCKIRPSVAPLFVVLGNPSMKGKNIFVCLPCALKKKVARVSRARRGRKNETLPPKTRTKRNLKGISAPPHDQCYMHYKDDREHVPAVVLCPECGIDDGQYLCQTCSDFIHANSKFRHHQPIPCALLRVHNEESKPSSSLPFSSMDKNNNNAPPTPFGLDDVMREVSQ